MAEEYVGKEQFGEFVKRMDDRFDYVDQRFDDLKESVSDIRADIRQMRNWLVWLFGLVVFGFIGSIVLILFRGAFK